MVENFLMQIDRFVLDSEARILAVVRQSISNVIEDAQTPVAKGGRMRVKTGFLRSSGVASLNGPPAGPGKGSPDRNYVWTGEPVNIALARLKIGDVFYFGWTAKYAKYRELYDGFLSAAAQKWQQHVDMATKQFKDKDSK